MEYKMLSQNQEYDFKLMIDSNIKEDISGTAKEAFCVRNASDTDAYDLGRMEAKVKEAGKLLKDLEDEEQQIDSEIEQKKRKLSLLGWQLSKLERKYIHSARILEVWERPKQDYLINALEKLSSTSQATTRNINISSSTKSSNNQSFGRGMLHGTKSLAQERELLREVVRKKEDDTDSCPSTYDLNWSVVYALKELQRNAKFFQNKGCIKQYLEECKKFKWARENYWFRDDYFKGKCLNDFVSKEVLQIGIKVRNKVKDKLKEKHLSNRARIKEVEDSIKEFEKDVTKLQRKLALKQQKKDEARKKYRKMKKQLSAMM